MRFPSKVTSYNNSTFARFPAILSLLKQHDMRPDELYKAVKTKSFDVIEFIDAMDCLFMLGKIELVAGGEVLHYVA